MSLHVTNVNQIWPIMAGVNPEHQQLVFKNKQTWRSKISYITADATKEQHRALNNFK